jgi:hypothetical protein
MVDVGDSICNFYDPSFKGLRVAISGMVLYAVAHLPGKVEPLAGILDYIYNSQALFVMAEVPGNLPVSLIS